LIQINPELLSPSAQRLQVKRLAPALSFPRGCSERSGKRITRRALQASAANVQAALAFRSEGTREQLISRSTWTRN
jgi:hypothetical protein